MLQKTHPHDDYGTSMESYFHFFVVVERMKIIVVIEPTLTIVVKNTHLALFCKDWVPSLYQKNAHLALSMHSTTNVHHS